MGSGSEIGPIRPVSPAVLMVPSSYVTPIMSGTSKACAFGLSSRGCLVIKAFLVLAGSMTGGNGTIGSVSHSCSPPYQSGGGKNEKKLNGKFGKFPDPGEIHPNTLQTDCNQQKTGPAPQIERMKRKNPYEKVPKGVGDLIGRHIA